MNSRHTLKSDTVVEMWEYVFGGWVTSPLLQNGIGNDGRRMLSSRRRRIIEDLSPRSLSVTVVQIETREGPVQVVDRFLLKLGLSSGRSLVLVGRRTESLHPCQEVGSIGIEKLSTITGSARTAVRTNTSCVGRRDLSAVVSKPRYVALRQRLVT